MLILLRTILKMETRKAFVAAELTAGSISLTLDLATVSKIAQQQKEVLPHTDAGSMLIFGCWFHIRSVQLHIPVGNFRFLIIIFIFTVPARGE